VIQPDAAHLSPASAGLFSFIQEAVATQLPHEKVAYPLIDPERAQAVSVELQMFERRTPDAASATSHAGALAASR
jgi:hypothetical protein